MKSVVHNNGGVDSIAVIGNYLPRQCGIATFTSDLSDKREIQRRNYFGEDDIERLEDDYGRK